MTAPVLAAAVRRTLAEQPEHFGAVSDHHATESALASLSGELANVDDVHLDRIAASGRGPATIIEVHRSVQARLAAYHDEAQVAGVASRRRDLADALGPHGQMIWYLPSPMSAPLASFLAVVFGLVETAVVIGSTGSAAADRSVDAVCRAVGVEVPNPAEPIGEPVADTILSVTDADEEVRAVLRSVVALVEEGVPLDRIGIFHPTPDPYVRILEQQLAAAAIPFNGPSRRRLGDSVAGRTLLNALSLPAQRWRRDLVMALISGAPLRTESGPVRPSAWDRISRTSGVVGGRADWNVKLAHRRSAVQRRLDESRFDDSRTDDSRTDDGTVGIARALERELADIDALAAFLDSLDRSIEAVGEADNWRTMAAAAKALLVSLLGPGHQHASWPETEQAGFERVEEVLDRLAELDDVDPFPSRVVFVRALTAELGVARGRSNRFGHGVVHGPLSTAVGQDLDAVFVLGCIEGLLPVARREDAMLSDAARSLAQGQLDLRAGRISDQHRQYLAALAAAPVGRRTLVMPRGSLRGGRAMLPSRWLLDTATAKAGRPIHATDFAQSGPAIVTEVASHASGLRNTGLHASVDDRDLAVVERHVNGGGDAAGHPSAAVVARGLQARSAREGAHFTEWDGNLAGHPIPSTAERPLSPTRLQSWAICGYQYFLGNVLGLDERDDPERMVDISPMDRGTGVHAVLEMFFGERIDRGDVPDPDEPWTAEDRERLVEIAADVFDEMDRRGRTGRPVRWQITKVDLLTLLDDFLIRDDAHRAATQSRPERVELPFGLGGRPPVVLDLPDGRSLAFRGKADRVDVDANGRRFVSDYKTGKGDAYRQIADGDPVQAGATLQLGLYAEAARQALGAAEVDAHYWMVNPSVGFQRYGYPWTDDRRKRMLEVLSVVADGIEGGLFPATPGEWNGWRGTHQACTHCAFDSLCSKDRGEHALAKQDAVELSPRRGLVWDPDSQAESEVGS